MTSRGGDTEGRWDGEMLKQYGCGGAKNEEVGITMREFWIMRRDIVIGQESGRERVERWGAMW